MRIGRIYWRSATLTALIALIVPFLLYELPACAASPAAQKELFLFDDSQAKLLTAMARLKTHPDDEETFYQACQYCSWKDDWITLNKLNAVYARKHPEWAAVHYELAKYAEKDIDDEGALTEYGKAIKIRPAWLAPRIPYVQILQRAGRDKECVAMVEDSLQYMHAKAPQEKYLKVMLLEAEAPALKHLGRYAEAADALSLSFELHGKNHAGTGHQLAEIYLASKQWDKVIKVTSDLLKFDSGDKASRKLRARAYFEKKEYKLALADIDKCLSGYPAVTKNLLPEMHDARRLKAKILDALGQKDLAKKERAIVDAAGKEIYGETIFRNKQ